MKYFLLAIGLASVSPAMAQRTQAHYDESVFSISKDLKPVSVSEINSTQKKVSAKFPGWNSNVDKLSAIFHDAYGPAITVPGATLQEKAGYCINNQLKELNVNGGEWQQVSVVNAPHASYIDFTQNIYGHHVAFSDLSFRFTKDGRLVRIKMTNYGTPENMQPKIDRTAALNAAGLNDGLNGTQITDKSVAADWEWFAIPSATGYAIHPAWAFTLNGTAANGFPLKLTGYIDGMTGELLYRTNDVKETFTGKVLGDSIYNVSPTLPPTQEPLTDLLVTDGINTDTTDSAGNYTFNTLSLPQSVTYSLQGRWSTVHTAQISGVTPAFTQALSTSGNTYVFPTTAPSSYKHINAYYNVNIIHDFMKKWFPSATGFTKMDFSMPTMVDVTSGSCNAFYSNKRINFYAQGNGCNSFTNINDVIYHEYGHGISDQFYNWKGKGTIINGALNEANSDIWALSVTRYPIIGRYYLIGDTNSYIRRYDIDPKVFPKDINGEVHNDGEIIAGSWWDVAVNTGSVDTMTKLFTETYYDTPDGPAGTEGTVYHDVLISAILNDDDDNNLSNGTPHLHEIASAFAKHGIYLMSDAQITHTELAHQPSGIPIDVTAKLTLTEDSSFFQGLKLFYRDQVAGIWDSVAMTSTGNNVYTAQIPAQNTAAVMDYYFATYDILNNSMFGFPNGYNSISTSDQVTIPYQFAVGVTQKELTDFETPVTDWKIGKVNGDNAKKGIWVQRVPTATTYSGSLPMQTGHDHTSGSGQCLTTGSGSQNVDSGKTTVLTKTFDLSNYTYPIIEYYRWYSNDRGLNGRTDAWQVQMRDTTSLFWKNVDYTYQSDYAWRRRVLSVKQYLPNAKYVQIRFIATDALNGMLQSYGQNTVVAALDDVALYDISDLSIDNISKDNKAVIYPNPSNSGFTVDLAAQAKGSIYLYDIMGRLLQNVEVTGASTLYAFSTATLPQGQYVIRIQTDKYTETQKVSVVH